MESFRLHFFMIILIGICSCSKYIEPEIFLLPMNYRGLILLIYDEDFGEDQRFEGKFRVYDIPNDGILLTKFPPNEGHFNEKIQQFFYVDGQERIRIPYSNLGDKDHPDSVYIYHGAIGNIDLFPFYSYACDFPSMEKAMNLEQAGILVREKLKKVRNKN